MFSSWISSNNEFIVTLPLVNLPNPSGITTSYLIPEIYKQGISFYHPKIDLSGDALLEILPRNVSLDSESDPIPALVRTYIEKFHEKHSSLEVLISEATVISGSRNLAGDGFVNDPGDLINTVARRYAFLGTLDVFGTILNKFLEAPLRAKFDRLQNKISLESTDFLPGSFAVTITGDLVSHCIKPIRFLPYAKLDRQGLRACLEESILYLQLLKKETQDGFNHLMTAYDSAYRDWLGF